MAFVKISEKELGEVGVELLDDQPALQPDVMKAKFEETAKQLLAPKFNTLVEQLEAETAAESLGAAVPEGMSEQTAKTVQAVLAALMAYIQAHENRKDNPHTVTAAQAGAYTKAETDKAIDAKVEQIGAGDMAKGVYDPQNKQQDVFAYADADKMRKSIYDTHNKGTDVYDYADDAAETRASEAETNANARACHLYKATFLLDGWSGSAAPYTQTVAVTAVDDGPAITADSYMTSAVMIDDTVQGDAQEALSAAAALVNGGTKTLGAGTITCTLQGDKPEADAEVYFTCKQGGA